MLIAAQFGVKERRDLVQEELERLAEEQEAAASKKAAMFQPLPSRRLVIPRGRFTRPSGGETGLIDL